jgi:hypothetical protein
MKLYEKVDKISKFKKSDGNLYKIIRIKEYFIPRLDREIIPYSYKSMRV